MRAAATPRDLRRMQQPRRPRKLVSILLALVRTVGLALLVYGVLMFALQRRLAFPGTSRESPRATASAPPGVTQVWLDASFGNVEAWFFGAPERATAARSRDGPGRASATSS